jgi:hypothetical protein
MRATCPAHLIRLCFYRLELLHCQEVSEIAGSNSGYQTNPIRNLQHCYEHCNESSSSIKDVEFASEEGFCSMHLAAASFRGVKCIM